MRSRREGAAVQLVLAPGSCRIDHDPGATSITPPMHKLVVGLPKSSAMQPILQ
jgi:hypothetical protein